MAEYVGGVMSSISFRSNAPGVNGIRTNQVFSRFGWGNVRHPYRVGSPEGTDVFKAFGVERKMTPSASKAATRLAVTQGSFREGSDAETSPSRSCARRRCSPGRPRWPNCAIRERTSGSTPTRSCAPRTGRAGSRGRS